MIRASDVDIPNPCSADWDEMIDHGRFRRCAVCDKPVYDFAQHTEAEIHALVAAGACRRIGIYADGSIVTRETQLVPVARLLRFARVAAIALPLAACDQSATSRKDEARAVETKGGDVSTDASAEPPSGDPSTPASAIASASATTSAAASASATVSASASAAPTPPPAGAPSSADCARPAAAPAQHPAGKKPIAGRKVADWRLGDQR